MYIDKKTGVLSVDMMWTCTKCSYAYNKVEDTKCEVCRVKRVTTPKEEMAGPDGDFQLLTQVKTVLVFSQLRWELDLLPHRDLGIATISETKPQLHTVWKIEKFTLTEEIFCEIDSFETSLVRTLLSRNFCQKMSE